MQISIISQVLWRHKVWSLLLVLLTLTGAIAVLFLVRPVYEASSSYLVIRPPDPPSQAQIQADPSLGQVNSDNPYVRLGDPSVIISVVSRSLESKPTKDRLLAAGVTDDYTVSPSNRFGFSSPIIDITVDSSSPEAAIDSVQTVGQAVVDELSVVQQVDKVDTRYTFTARLVEAADEATARSSGKLRALIGVLGVGAVCMFILVMSLHAVDRRRDAQLEADFLIDMDDSAVRLDKAPRHRLPPQLEAPATSELFAPGRKRQLRMQVGGSTAQANPLPVPTDVV